MRSLVLGLGLLGILLGGRAVAPMVYRLAFLNPQLAAAIKDYNLPRTERLIDSGADINLRIRVNPEFGGILAAPESPLELAVRKYDAAAIRRMIAKGADVHQQNSLGAPPLLPASIVEKPDAALALLEAGADISARDKNGYTALMYASQLGKDAPGQSVYRPSTTEMLLKHGADPNVENRQGDTALSLAEQIGCKRMVATLRRAGARGLHAMLKGVPEAELFYAVRTQDMATVKRLIKQGGRVAVQDKDGLTPLMYAAGQYDGRIVHYLIHHAVDLKQALEVKDRDGSTVLARSTIWDYSFKLLLEAGADPNVTYNGHPLVDYGSPTQKDLLIAAGAKSTR